MSALMTAFLQLCQRIGIPPVVVISLGAIFGGYVAYEELGLFLALVIWGGIWIFSAIAFGKEFWTTKDPKE